MLLVFHYNTMIFNNKYLHQIKGIAVGTRMAVNFANLFIGKFERETLFSYEKLYGFRLQLCLFDLPTFL